jgi:hypothetical protein
MDPCFVTSNDVCKLSLSGLYSDSFLAICQNIRCPHGRNLSKFQNILFEIKCTRDMSTALVI